MNQREIKFRAWDSNEKFMADWKTVSWEFPKVLSSNHIHVMQFTGLKDKNGKEIYEGDVCIVGDGGEQFPEELNEKTDEYEPIGKYAIKWSDLYACFTLESLDGKELDLEYSPFNDAEFEVIGNIYENPELS